MKLVICALAKDENAYINEWVSYHLNLGFDTIYLYDNNSSETPYVGSFIEEQYRDRVVIIDYRNKDMRSRQHVAYNDWLNNYMGDADFCAFIDIDEFIVTEDIKKLVSRMPADFDFMALNWQMYDGGDELEGDESKPVRNRFTRKYGSCKNMWNTCIKTIIRCKSRYPIKCLNAHGFYYNKYRNLSKYCDCNGGFIKLLTGLKFARNPFEHHDSYIAHYATKSLSEYLKYKVGRIGVIWDTNRGKLNYFFRNNKKTPEKLAYIEKYLKENAG